MSAGQRVAVVGCGRMGAQRARAAHRLGAELVLSDGDEQRSRLLASEFPSASTTPPQQLDWAALDAVFVCTPAGARGPVEVAAAAAGVAVFVEKPIALSADRAQRNGRGDPIEWRHECGRIHEQVPGGRLERARDAGGPGDLRRAGSLGRQSLPEGLVDRPAGVGQPVQRSGIAPDRPLPVPGRRGRDGGGGGAALGGSPRHRRRRRVRAAIRGRRVRHPAPQLSGRGQTRGAQHLLAARLHGPHRVGLPRRRLGESGRPTWTA